MTLTEDRLILAIETKNDKRVQEKKECIRNTVSIVLFCLFVDEFRRDKPPEPGKLIFESRVRESALIDL